MSSVKCGVCPRGCLLRDGDTGFCMARRNDGGRVVSLSYGYLTSLALDPVEKKPLKKFMPGSRILSVGSFGCNMRCKFCQNYCISMSGSEDADKIYVSPDELVAKAKALRSSGNIGIAYTYNEPFIGFEYMYDCAARASSAGMKNVIVTNGFVNEEPLRHVLPYVDAMNIDVKGFADKVYAELGGSLDVVKRTVRIAKERCHVELTALIVPGLNDNDEDMLRLSEWAANIDENMPLHVTRFFPCYEMYDKSPTPVETVYRMADVARRHLRFVYEGNV